MKLLSSGENQRIRRIVDGDERAFQSLIRDYYPLAYNLACKMLSNRQDAEEVVQDAFVKIREALDSFRGDASLKTWDPAHRHAAELEPAPRSLPQFVEPHGSAQSSNSGGG